MEVVGEEGIQGVREWDPDQMSRVAEGRRGTQIFGSGEGGGRVQKRRNTLSTNTPKIMRNRLQNTTKRKWWRAIGG